MIKFLHRFEDTILVTALFAMLGFALVQIGLRNFFDAGIFWAESFLRILVLWVAMLGAMVATRTGNHISINAVQRFLPCFYVRWVAALTNLVSAAVCGTVAWFSFELVRFEYEDGIIAFAGVPNWVCQSILPVGFGVMALRFFARVFRG